MLDLRFFSVQIVDDKHLFHKGPDDIKQASGLFKIDRGSLGMKLRAYAEELEILGQNMMTLDIGPLKECLFGYKKSSDEITYYIVVWGALALRDANVERERVREEMKSFLIGYME